MKYGVLIFTFLVLGISVYANGKKENDQEYYGYNMMGPGYGYGMMGGGMMGGYPGYAENGERMDLDSVRNHVDDYLKTYNYRNLSIAEIMEFHQNFYVQIADANSAFLFQELIVDPYSGNIYPEPGPNMMWNLSTPHMMNSFSGKKVKDMTVSEDEAVRIAAEYLDSTLPGTTPEEHGDKFNGYYTLHVMKNDSIIGMLSVNGYTGQVWYHNWHGEFLGMEDSH